jgi:DNA-directed RNA polymerase specialized sigma24 family protein
VLEGRAMTSAPDFAGLRALVGAQVRHHLRPCDVEDVTQVVLHKLLRRWRAGIAVANWEGLATKLVRDKVADSRRCRRRLRTALEDDLGVATGPTRSPELVDRLIRVLRQRLSPAELQVLVVVRDCAPRTLQELSESLGYGREGVGCVQRILKRDRKKVADLGPLERHGGLSNCACVAARTSREQQRPDVHDPRTRRGACDGTSVPS